MKHILPLLGGILAFLLLFFADGLMKGQQDVEQEEEEELIDAETLLETTWRHLERHSQAIEALRLTTIHNTASPSSGWPSSLPSPYNPLFPPYHLTYASAADSTTL